MTDLPALMLPCGCSSGPPALPIGLQLYGRAFDASTLYPGGARLRAGHGVAPAAAPAGLIGERKRNRRLLAAVL